MSEQNFADFLARVRAGDESASQELFDRYEPFLRREVRLRLNDPAVARVTDPEDICQSVLRSFFTRAALGQYELTEPAQLAGLLLGMARKKLAGVARKNHAQRRDGRRVAEGSLEEIGVACPGPSPSRVVAARQMLEAVRQLLSEDERQMVELRGQGYGWAEIAAQLGGNADARRIQFGRAMDRVCRQLNLEDEDD